MDRRHTGRRARPALAALCALALAGTLGVGSAAAAAPTAAPAVAPGQQPAGPPPTVVDPRSYPLTPTSIQPESVVYDARSASFYASSSNGG